MFPAVVLLAVRLTALSTATDTLTPGHPALKTLQLRLGTDTTEVFSIVSGNQRKLNTSVQTVAATRTGYLITHFSASPAGAMLDSTWVERGTFATQRHVFIASGTSKRLDFHGRHVTGVETDSAGSHAIDRMLTSDAFDNSVGGIIATALPSTEGYSAVIASYDVSGQYNYMTVRMLGRDTLTHAARVVPVRKMASDFSSGGRSWSVTHWLDEKSSRELRWELSIQGRGMLGIATP